MPIKDFSVNNILARIVLTLPSKFDISKNKIKAFFTGVAAGLKLNTDLVDELFRQTNIVSASGEYLDFQISDLAAIGRRKNENDNNYRNRYYNQIFKYNASKNGIKSILLDFLPPSQIIGLFNKSLPSGFYDDCFYGDIGFESIFGGGEEDNYRGVIELTSEPSSGVIEDICESIFKSKSSGINIIIVWPSESPSGASPSGASPSGSNLPGPISSNPIGNTFGTPGTINWNWGAAPYATSYDWNITNEISPEPTSWYNTIATQQSTQVQGGGITYKFWVRGRNSSGVGPVAFGTATTPMGGGGF